MRFRSTWLRNGYEGIRQPTGRTVLQAPVDQHDGCVVKTIDDAPAKQIVGSPSRTVVFPDPLRQPQRPYAVSAAFKRVARAAGFPDMRFHDLHHTSATLALAAGVHPKIVSERLGHSTIAITLDTYSHVLPNMQDAAAEALDAVIPQMPPSADAAS